MAPVTPAEALADIKGLARAGRYRFTKHALLQMDERGLSEREVSTALCYAHDCHAGEGERWCAIGRDRDGEVLTIVVAIEDEVIVITVFGG